MPPRKQPEQSGTVVQPPANNRHDREQQMIALADALAEKQLREGTASSQVITHYLKLASSREQLEQERIRSEIALAQQKELHMASQARTEEMVGEVLTVLKKYAGAGDEDGSEF